MVIVLLVVVFSTLFGNNQSKLFAQTVSQDGSSEGFVVGTTQTQSGTSYIMVLHHRPMDDLGKKNLDVPEGHNLSKRVTLSLYKIGITGLVVDLAGVRDITYDTQMISIPTPVQQALNDVKTYYKEMVKRLKESGPKDPTK